MAILKAGPLKKKQRGLTLIEVLVALVIISIAFTAIVLSTSRNIRDTRYVQNKMIATWVAANVMNQARAGILELSESQSEKTTLLGQEWTWKGSQHATANPAIQKIEVSAGLNAENKLINLVSYVYKEPPK